MLSGSIFGFGGGDKSRAGNEGKTQISVDEFKKWLMKFDQNKDGRISRSELRDAIKSRGARFTWWRSGCAMGKADVDGSGYIDEDEINYLLRFAKEKLRFEIL
ncbi:hypothetical protein CDL12_30462 [Handroanthus impetiginosus]|uniref:EF-hand domain-containing protein n=1 Tax=Handroanthus impetiginosus TaxID=429701 RepID=A0A2G9FVF1_9LAMI|nr:hypothetical protein CDL12_30462 [Handroanthus impetiginosus]